MLRLSVIVVINVDISLVNVRTPAMLQLLAAVAIVVVVAVRVVVAVVVSAVDAAVVAAAETHATTVVAPVISLVTALQHQWPVRIALPVVAVEVAVHLVVAAMLATIAVVLDISRVSVQMRQLMAPAVVADSRVEAAADVVEVAAAVVVHDATTATKLVICHATVKNPACRNATTATKKVI